MGRELRRKQAKKEGKSLKPEAARDDNQIKKLLLITLLLVFIIFAIYMLSALFVTKELDWFDKDTDVKPAELASNTILASEIFKQSEDVYYVYFYDYNDEDVEVSAAVGRNIPNSKVYRVDTGSALNSNYVSEQSNKKAKNLTELKVKAPTVIKIEGDTISAYYEGDEIKNSLK